MENNFSDKLTRRGFKTAENITKKHAKTFYFASKLLPIEKRYASYSTYAICRISDDAVDQPNHKPAHKNIESIRKQIDLAFSSIETQSPLLLAFRNTVRKYDIPKPCFEQLLQGMEMDLYKNKYASFEELNKYCYYVAGVVGLIMLKIFDPSNSRAQSHALFLGIAMQLTNILRDIKEDLAKTRVYLPQDELEKFGVSEENLKNGIINEGFKELMKFQILRAREYYNKSLPGIKLINNKKSRLATLIMKELYEGILGAIEKNDFDVFGKRAHISFPRKILILLGILINGNYR